jgi:hypothetical protein
MSRRFWLKTTVAAALTVGLAAAVLQPHSTRAAVVEGQTVLGYALASGPDETPATDSKGTGFGRFVLSQDRTRLLYEIRMSGLSGPATAMHLHAGPRGTPGGVVVPLDTPVNGESIGCKEGITTDVANAFVNQGLYLNIHTDKHKGGEIRGQVILAP